MLGLCTEVLSSARPMKWHLSWKWQAILFAPVASVPGNGRQQAGKCPQANPRHSVGVCHGMQVMHERFFLDYTPSVRLSVST